LFLKISKFINIKILFYLYLDFINIDNKKYGNNKKISKDKNVEEKIKAIKSFFSLIFLRNKYKFIKKIVPKIIPYFKNTRKNNPCEDNLPLISFLSIILFFSN
tara:strand:+ start:359 stop:667 length:309 start_codon:yes stop_codon:yes gene_type:complete